MAKTGSVIIICGYTGAGKSPMVHTIIEDSGISNLIVHDLQGEYDPNRFTIFRDYGNFRKIFNVAENSALIVEEATPFLNSFTEEEMVKQLISVEHRHNLIIFCLHSMMDIPPYVLRFSHWCILLDTADDLKKIKNQRPQLYEYALLQKPQFINLKLKK